MFIPDPHQEKSSLWAIDGHLTDNFIEGLAEQFLSNRAYPLSSSLSILQGSIKFFFKMNDIISFSSLMGNILHEIFRLTGLPFSREDHIVKNIWIWWIVPSGLGLGSNDFCWFFDFSYSSILSVVYISVSYLIKEKGASR